MYYCPKREKTRVDIISAVSVRTSQIKDVAVSLACLPAPRVRRVIAPNAESVKPHLLARPRPFCSRRIRHRNRGRRPRVRTVPLGARR